MKQISGLQLALISLASFMSAEPLQAQLTGISIENVFEHNGTVGDIPAGYTTYRIYAELTNELDFVSSVYGDADAPISLQSTGTIYQTPWVVFMVPTSMPTSSNSLHRWSMTPG